MPNIKSAIKRVKTAEKAHLRNMSTKSAIKSNIKKIQAALTENNQKDIQQYFKNTVSSLDKAVNKGIITKGTASRKKSRLAQKINTILHTEKPVEVPEAEETIKEQNKIDAIEKAKSVTKSTKKKVKKSSRASAKKVEKPQK